MEGEGGEGELGLKMAWGRQEIIKIEKMLEELLLKYRGILNPVVWHSG